MKGQSSHRKQAKFSRRILCSSQRILRSPMPNEQTAKHLNWPLRGNFLSHLNWLTAFHMVSNVDKTNA